MIDIKIGQVRVAKGGRKVRVVGIVGEASDEVILDVAFDDQTMSVMFLKDLIAAFPFIEE